MTVTALTSSLSYTPSSELSMGWVDQRVGLGGVGLGRDFAVFDGLGWVEYDKSTMFLMITQHTILRDRSS